MKLLSLFFLTIFLGKGCTSEQQKDIADTILEYSSVTRGSSLKVTVQNKAVTVSRNSRGANSQYSENINDADWNELISEFRKIDIDNLPDLKAPTQKRLYDGAGTANLTVTYHGKVSQTSGFDNGYPPAEIQKLVEKMLSFVKKEE